MTSITEQPGTPAPAAAETNPPAKAGVSARRAPVATPKPKSRKKATAAKKAPKGRTKAKFAKPSAREGSKTSKILALQSGPAEPAPGNCSKRLAGG
jgi:hypothetical protein